MSFSPPVPIEATFDTVSTLAAVTFDKPLVEGVLNTANWYLYAVPIAPGILTLWHPIAPVEAVGSQVLMEMVDVGSQITDTPNVNYTPPPYDLIALSGGINAGFTAFPLTVT